jgi:hypothetical protein
MTDKPPKRNCPVIRSSNGLELEIVGYGTVHVDPDRGLICMSKRPVSDWSQPEINRVIGIVHRAYPDAEVITLIQGSMLLLLPFSDLRREQQMVDPQPRITVVGIAEIIPERVNFLSGCRWRSASVQPWATN